MSTEAERPRRPYRSAALLLLAVGVVLLALVLAPGFQRARVASNETAAIGRLRTLSTSEAQFQSACIVDADGDGKGEFGWLAELSGAAVPRGRERALVQTFLNVGFDAGDTSFARRSGYLYTLYLPTATGQAAREPGRAVEPRAVDADLQEARFVAYTWPQQSGWTGQRSFAVSQQGEVFAGADVEYSGRHHFPEVGAVLVPDARSGEPMLRGDEISPDLGTPANAAGNMITGDRNTGDGGTWLPAGC